MRVARYIVLTAGLMLTSTAGAQGRGQIGSAIPPGHAPPEGMCRVWRDGVPPGRQARPTDCATAQRAARAGGGRVIYAGGQRDDGRYGRDDDRRYGRDDDRRNDRDDDRRYDRDDDRRYDRDDDRRYDRDDDRRYDRERTRIMNGRTRIGAAWLPRMPNVRMLQRGTRFSDYDRWLGNVRANARYTDGNRDGIPERVVWYDGRREVIQVWEDTDRDGRAERVRVYRNGRQVAVHQ